MKATQSLSFGRSKRSYVFSMKTLGVLGVTVLLCLLSSVVPAEGMDQPTFKKKYEKIKGDADNNGDKEYEVKKADLAELLPKEFQLPPEALPYKETFKTGFEAYAKTSTIIQPDSTKNSYILNSLIENEEDAKRAYFGIPFKRVDDFENSTPAKIGERLFGKIEKTINLEDLYYKNVIVKRATYLDIVLKNFKVSGSRIEFQENGTTFSNDDVDSKKHFFSEEVLVVEKLPIEGVPITKNVFDTNKFQDWLEKKLVMNLEKSDAKKNWAGSAEDRKNALTAALKEIFVLPEDYASLSESKYGYVTLKDLHAVLKDRRIGLESGKFKAGAKAGVTSEFVGLADHLTDFSYIRFRRLINAKAEDATKPESAAGKKEQLLNYLKCVKSTCDPKDNAAEKFQELFIALSDDENTLGKAYKKEFFSQTYAVAVTLDEIFKTIDEHIFPQLLIINFDSYLNNHSYADEVVKVDVKMAPEILHTAYTNFGKFIKHCHFLKGDSITKWKDIKQDFLKNKLFGEIINVIIKYKPQLNAIGYNLEDPDALKKGNISNNNKEIYDVIRSIQAENATKILKKKDNQDDTKTTDVTTAGGTVVSASDSGGWCSGLMILLYGIIGVIIVAAGVAVYVIRRRRQQQLEGV